MSRLQFDVTGGKRGREDAPRSTVHTSALWGQGLLLGVTCSFSALKHNYQMPVGRAEAGEQGWTTPLPFVPCSSQ